MSETATAFNHAAHLAGNARAYTGMYVNDLKYMPEESFANGQGGVTRSVAGITADAAWLANCVAHLLRGETPPSMDYSTHVDLVPGLNSREACTKAISSAGNALADAIENLPSSKFGDKIMAPWGAETTMYALGASATGHIWYHDAQLNYIQSLAGDGEVHWMG
jgi:hypothetical protein